MPPTNTSWGCCVYCSSINTCQLVYCLSINEGWVGLLFVSFNGHVVRTFARWHWAVCQISSLHAWAAWKHGPHVIRKTGLHVILSTLHLRTLYIENSRTRQVVYIHVHYGVHSEMYIGIDSRLIDLSLCCKKRLRFWLPNQNYLRTTLKSDSLLCFPPADHRDSIPWLENRPNERTI